MSNERDKRRERLRDAADRMGQLNCDKLQDDMVAELKASERDIQELSSLKSLLRRADGSAKWWAEVAKVTGPVEDVE